MRREKSLGGLYKHVSGMLNIKFTLSKNVDLGGSSQLVQRVLLYPHDLVQTSHEILIATFCFQNWWSRTAKALQLWETPNRCNSDNHSNFKMTLTFLQCGGGLARNIWHMTEIAAFTVKSASSDNAGLACYGYIKRV